MGYVFVAGIAVILIVNITMMLKGNGNKFLLKQKKKSNQIAYIKRFKEYSSVERLSYMMKMDKN